jgi:fucose 4-O-acetylase-like acetyltransferase
MASPAAPTIFCNSCGMANTSSNSSCVSCGRPFPELQYLASAISRPPSGVGGWLLLFCFAVCFSAPAWFVRTYLHSPFMLHWYMFASAVPVLLGIVAGALLAMERAQALVVLRIFFVALAAKSAIWFAMAVVEDNASFLRVAIPTLLQTVVWGLYFQNSARVRNTYGRNL